MLAAGEGAAGLPTARPQDGEGVVGPLQRLGYRPPASALAEGQLEVLLDGQVGEDPATLGDVRSARPGDLVRGQPGDRRDRSAAGCRQVVASRPVTTRETVDLPAPFEPMSAVMPASGTSKLTSNRAR